MNKSGWERVEKIIWDRIARDLEREGGIARCLCFHDRFLDHLQAAGLPFALENYPGSGSEKGTAELFLGWQVLNEEGPLLTPGEIFSSLGDGGEARIFGVYSSPWTEDLQEWAGPEPLRLPPPGAVSLAAVAGWLKPGPFNRYTLRKRGIYYECRLGKDD
jgi:hypothetical protein